MVIPGNGPRIGKLQRPRHRKSVVSIVGNNIRWASRAGATPPGDMPAHDGSSLAAAAPAVLLGLPAAASTCHLIQFSMSSPSFYYFSISVPLLTAALLWQLSCITCSGWPARPGGTLDAT